MQKDYCFCRLLDLQFVLAKVQKHFHSELEFVHLCRWCPNLYSVFADHNCPLHIGKEFCLAAIADHQSFHQCFAKDSARYCLSASIDLDSSLLVLFAWATLGSTE